MKKILVVDDEPHICNLIKLTLKNNYEIREANSGNEALVILRDFKADLVLLDIMMPELNGYDTLTEIRNDEKLKDLPVIFLTAKSQTVDKIKAMELGADEYITKPFDVIELEDKINLFLLSKK